MRSFKNFNDKSQNLPPSQCTFPGQQKCYMDLPTLSLCEYLTITDLLAIKETDRHDTRDSLSKHV